MTSHIEEVHQNNHHFLLDTSDFLCPDLQIFQPDYWKAQGALTGQASGRGTTYFFKQGDRQYVLRKYLRGGLIGKILDDQFFNSGLYNSRAWVEFKLLQTLQEKSLPAPRPVAALCSKHGLFTRSFIICERIANASDVHQLISRSRLSDKTWANIGTTIAMFHAQQVYHHDLNIHNIMLDSEEKAFLIDFDKCSIKSGETWKKANIQRLRRSLEKEKAKTGEYHWSESDWQSLLNGYEKGKEAT